MKATTALQICLLTSSLMSCADSHFDKAAPPPSGINPSKSDTCSIEINRYANGSISSTGMVCNGKKHGLWRAFYSDGALKWEGEYRLGYRTLPNLESLPDNCSFVFDDTTNFAVNKGIQFRVVAPPLGPKDMIIHISSGKYGDPTDSDNFDYMVIPAASGELCIELDYAHRSGYPICKKCISIP